VQEMLAQKELDLARVQRELQALRIVASLLQDEENWVKETADPTRNVTVVQRSAAQGEDVIPKSRGWRKTRAEGQRCAFRGAPSLDSAVPSVLKVSISQRWRKISQVPLDKCTGGEVPRGSQVGGCGEDSSMIPCARRTQLVHRGRRKNLFSLRVSETMNEDSGEEILKRIKNALEGWLLSLFRRSFRAR
jgi:hypothetical protein